MIYTGGSPGGPFEDMYWYLNDPDYHPEVADDVVNFFKLNLTHTKGRWKGEPFELFDWQEHRIIRPLFGILREAPSKKHPIGLRRYKKAYIEIPKKNGKSELIAGIGVKLFVGDFEGAAEVYSAAADKEQATIIHGVSAQMVRNDEDLDAIIKILDSRKRMVSGENVYIALSSEVATKHGLNVSGCLFDELHAQKTSALWDVLTKGSTKAREQPLIFAITTAGYDRESVCWKERERAVRVLTGETKDDTFLPVIYGMDKDEDWESEENWRAVNPSMDKIFSFESFKEDFIEAKELPYSENLFRRLALNQWTQQETRFIPMTEWDSLPAIIIPEELKGRACYAGVDLSTTTDLTSSCYAFPDENGGYELKWNFWIPEVAMKARIERDRVPYDVWVREGFVTAIPGSVIDYDWVQSQFTKDAELYDINEIGYDPYNASQWAGNMEDEGFNMIVVRQGYLTLSPTTKDLLRLILQGKINHGGNPVARSHAANMVVKTDASGNIKPDKEKRTQKIDGMIAMICALDCALRHAVEYGASEDYHEVGML